MAIHNAIRYRGFTLDYEPIRRNESCYVAQVIISRESGQVLDEYAFQNLCVKSSAPSAAEFGRVWGRKWVDEHGDWKPCARGSSQGEEE